MPAMPLPKLTLALVTVANFCARPLRLFIRTKDNKTPLELEKLRTEHQSDTELINAATRRIEELQDVVHQQNLQRIIDVQKIARLDWDLRLEKAKNSTERK